jgi:hypothetical protein
MLSVRHALAAVFMLCLELRQASPQPLPSPEPGMDVPSPAIASEAATAPLPPPPSQPGPLRVTTDTPEYCGHLAGRIATAQATLADNRPEVMTLATEGQHLCAIGHIRGGIVRLRRALIMLLQADK